MSVKMGQTADPTFVNRLLATNFQVMDEMGQRTIKPFLQDVVRFDGLIGSLVKSFVADPLFTPQIVNTVGIPELIDWMGHVGNVSGLILTNREVACFSFLFSHPSFCFVCAQMAKYSVLDAVVTPIMSPLVDKIKKPRDKFQWRRRMEAWKFGSGADYKFNLPDEEPGEKKDESTR
jgi:hypothetical protein